MSWSPPLAKIGAPSAWDLSHGDDVVIAILDSGVDGNHPDLAAHMVPGYNFYDNNTNSADVNGHVHTGEKRANAALIAAAPEMLECLERLCSAPSYEIENVKALARDVISKAKGE